MSPNFKCIAKFLFCIASSDFLAACEELPTNARHTRAGDVTAQWDPAGSLDPAAGVTGSAGDASVTDVLVEARAQLKNRSWGFDALQPDAGGQGCLHRRRAAGVSESIVRVTALDAAKRGEAVGDGGLSANADGRL